MVSKTSPATLYPFPGPWRYLCKNYPLLCPPPFPYFDDPCLSKFKSATTSSRKIFLMVLISVASTRSTHYTLFYHNRTYFITCFLECSKANIKVCTPGTEFLPPRPHSIVLGPDIWVLWRTLGNSRTQAWGQVYVRAACCILNARPSTSCLGLHLLHSQEINQTHVFVLFTQTVHSLQPCVITYIRPLSPSQVSPTSLMVLHRSRHPIGEVVVIQFKKCMLSRSLWVS